MAWNKSTSSPALQRPPEPREERPSGSFLVRFWLEPGETEGESATCRGYARDLQTGEECYFGDPSRFAEQVFRGLRPSRQEQGADGESDGVEAAAG
ncbi:MAG: hypothetical protein AAF657_11085 [Acidobacteriota bacterium]